MHYFVLIFFWIFAFLYLALKQQQQQQQQQQRVAVGPGNATRFRVQNCLQYFIVRRRRIWAAHNQKCLDYIETKRDGDMWRRDVHGLDSSMDWIGLGPMTVMYKIITAYVFQLNSARLCYVIISDYLYKYDGAANGF